MKGKNSEKERNEERQKNRKVTEKEREGRKTIE